MSKTLRRRSEDVVMNDRDDGNDGREQDIVMPGFRFHPTEEELVEFYLRWKVEGRRFNVDLITYLDLYRYDPWELPAFATIGEKEWFFYVPRDRKYRNGDRPNRVTTSGYWKATGADRMIKGEGSRPIGLKKTLVFYYGKAPKGVRTCWIMNEYRLPHDQTDLSKKAEISLCRVYKRAGIGEPNLPGTVSSKASSSSKAVGSAKKQNHRDKGVYSSTGESSSDKEKTGTTSPAPLLLCTRNIFSNEETEDEVTPFQQPKNIGELQPASRILNSFSASMPASIVDEFNRVVDYPHSYLPDHQSQLQNLLLPQSQIPSLTSLSTAQTSFADKIWSWNSSASDSYTGFKG
ncbi:NAC domain-containing protein 35-like [Wolffia australiana]